MAFSEFEQALNQKALTWFMDQRRPPEHIRPQLDIGYTVSGHTVDLFEIRPDWQDQTTIRHTPIARVRYVRTQSEWRLYWMRRDLKWHAYEPAEVHSDLLSALEAVDRDAHCCFFG